MTEDVGEIQRRFAEFAAMADHTRMPLYGRFAAGVVDDPDVAARLLLAHHDQRVPTLLLAAVHDTLLAGTADPLAQWFGSVVSDARRVGTGDDDPWPHFRRLVLEDEDVAERLRTGSTQTNEVGRTATLLPVLARLAVDAPGAPPDGARPLGLVEIGASAGLNLLLDRYGYRYERPDGSVHEVQPDAPLTIGCVLRGHLEPRWPDAVPHVASRIGIDLHPVDLSDPRQARWLVACQWPEQPERFHRARTAIALAHGDRAEVLTGDAVEEAADLVRAVPQHALPVVIATWMASYLPLARQRDLLASLDAVAAERDLSFVFADDPALVPGLPVPPRPDGAPDGRPTALVRVDWRVGVRSAHRLADQHPHGTWMEWLEA